jgi:hypothetical protein
MRFLISIAVPALLLGVGCSTSSTVDSSKGDKSLSNEFIWVARHFTGGRQCEPVTHYTPPSVEQLLHAAGISAYQTQTQHNAVCEACSCPTYSATHFVLIRREQSERARQVGFEANEPQQEQ